MSAAYLSIKSIVKCAQLCSTLSCVLNMTVKINHQDLHHSQWWFMV